MTKERRKQQIQKIHEQLEALKEKARRLEAEDKQADDAEKMKIIEKNKISIDELIMLTRLSEQEIKELLGRKQQDETNTVKEQEIHEKNEIIH